VQQELLDQELGLACKEGTVASPRSGHMSLPAEAAVGLSVFRWQVPRAGLADAAVADLDSALTPQVVLRSLASWVSLGEAELTPPMELVVVEALGLSDQTGQRLSEEQAEPVMPALSLGLPLPTAVAVEAADLLVRDQVVLAVVGLERQ
jgi:hypothetical protein